MGSRRTNRVRQGLAGWALAIALMGTAGCTGDSGTLAPRSSAGPASGASSASGSAIPPPDETEAGSATPGSSPTDSAGATQPGTDPAGPTASPPAGAPAPPSDVTADESARQTLAAPSDLPPATAGLPDGWPTEVALPPAAEVYADPAAGSAGRSVAFKAPGTPADLGAFFAAELAAAGYAAVDQSSPDGAFTASFTRDGTTVEVALVAADAASVGTVAITP